MGHSSKVSLVFEATGSRGDVSPMIAAASTMARRGYESHVFANDTFAHDATRCGVHFVGISRQVAHSRGTERYSRDRYLFPALPEAARAFRELRSKPTLVVNTDRYAASNMICEADEIPVVRIHLTPYKIRSLISPPWPFGRHAQGRLGEAYRKYALPRFYRACDTDPRVLDYVNAKRESFGLGRVANASYCEPHLRRQMAFFPSWYGQPAPDWPSEMDLLGFPLPRAERSVPSALTDFLQREGDPLVFTPGTFMVDVSEFFAHAAECCRVMGLPGVFLSPHFRGGTDYHGLRILHLDYVDLEQVLHRAKLIVHHGGIGTTARALQAGIPQIICPGGFDQPDNGHRVEVLDVGRVLERPDYTGATLARLVRELLDDPGVRRQLEATRQSVRGEDAMARCADALEEQVGIELERQPSTRIQQVECWESIACNIESAGSADSCPKEAPGELD